MSNRRQALFASGVHFGHRCSSWSPKMAPFIWGKKDGIHLIDIAHTEVQITKAEKLLEEVAAKGLPILWVGTKKVARNTVSSIARDTESPYFIDRWVGGTLTNYHEVKKSVTNLLHNKDIIEKADRQVYTKKELGILNKKIERATKTIGGIQKLAWPVGALVVADVQKDYVSIKEAVQAGVPIVALVDTNCNPEGIDIAIPCNDDLEKAVNTVFGFLADAVKRGKETFEKNKPVAAEIKKETSSADSRSSKSKVVSSKSKKTSVKTSSKEKAVESSSELAQEESTSTSSKELASKSSEKKTEKKASSVAKEKKTVAKKVATKKVSAPKEKKASTSAAKKTTAKKKSE